MDEQILTPMMNQYYEIKRRYHDSLLFFRLGDFYELFFDDAKVASSELNITLTSREATKNVRIPMCGVPYHSAHRYIQRLLNKGYKVTIVEQLEEAKPGRLVKRDVIRTITPGTIIDPQILDEKTNNYLAALIKEDNNIAIAVCDVSTGEFKTTQIDDTKILFNELTILNPAEYLIPKYLEYDELIKNIKQKLNPFITFLEDDYFEYFSCYEELINHFNVTSLHSFTLDDKKLCILTCGCIMKYLKETQKTASSHISGIAYYNLSDYMLLDEETITNLELIKPMRTFAKGSATLYKVLDKTKTPMGKRLLKNYIEKPLIKIELINDRLDAIRALKEDIFLLKDIQDNLKNIYDIERLISKITYGLLIPKDLINLKISITNLPTLKELISKLNTKIFNEIVKNFDTLSDIRELIENAINEDAPTVLKEGSLIKDGFSKEVDELRYIKKEGKKLITQLEEKERERTGIKSLKIGYNQVFGYYIEVTNPNLNLVPNDYIRRQTLSNAERFITNELKDLELKVLTSNERLIELEYELFCEVRDYIKANVKRIKKVAQIISQIDILQSLTQVAIDNNYTQPIINEDSIIYIKDGRHPVVEQTQLDKRFIPNDTYIDNNNNRILIITGPNMAGKSTYIRQVALIVLLAQIGSYVPAKEATIGIVDRIFTRCGATDEIAHSRSTFMVEMQNTAAILNNATNKSLIVLDEIGRGTSTYDGLSIAWATIEYINNNKRLKTRTLFATHYHEMIKLEEEFSSVKNYNVAVKETEDGVIFLHKIVRGGAPRSYGIYVAKLAGIPQEVLNRARIIMQQLEKSTNERKELKITKPSRQQLSLFEEYQNPIIERLKSLNINTLTPLQALIELEKLKKMVK